LTDTNVPEDYPTIERIATKLITQMRTISPKGPYQLAGYSLGGSIVYEMARQLQAAGESVPTLILLDHYAPGHPVLPPFLVRTLLHIKQGVRLGPRQMWPYLIKYTLRLRRFVVDVEPQLYSGMVDDGSSPLFSDLNRGAQQILRAQRRYQIARYPGRLMLIRAEDMSEYGIGAGDTDPTGGWRDWVADALYMGGLPCKHTQMLDVSNARQLGELMRRCLTLGCGSLS
jgi:acetoacetyl-CoA synthetase